MKAWLKESQMRICLHFFCKPCHIFQRHLVRVSERSLFDMRFFLIAVGILYLATAFYLFFAPHAFYENTPGVAMIGPINLHFMRDAALAFLVSGSALIWAARKSNRDVAIFGAAWPFAHALFHIWIWLARGTPFDIVALTNLVGIQLPAWLAMIGAIKLSNEGPRHA
ncbi:MAG: hypothetical protein AAGB16_07585 [Pseudomonadota bacterium]